MDLSDINRRRFLSFAGTLGCSAAAYPLMTPVTLASAPWDARLVVIVLRGALDGLDVLRPVGDPDFSGLRSDFGSEAQDLDGFFSLHDACASLRPLWQSEELAFAHAVSTPYRNERSHFDGQDMLEAGTAVNPRAATVRDGWLNRLLQITPGVESETGFAIERGTMRIREGDAPVASWVPGLEFRLGDTAEALLR